MFLKVEKKGINDLRPSQVERNAFTWSNTDIYDHGILY